MKTEQKKKNFFKFKICKYKTTIKLITFKRKEVYFKKQIETI